MADEIAPPGSQGEVLQEPDTTELLETSPITDEGSQKPSQEIIDDNRIYEVKVDGQIQKLTAREMREGYMRQSDYTRKTQELAEMRRLLAEQRPQEQHKDKYSQAKEQIVERIKSKYKDIDPEFLDMMLDGQAQFAALKAQESIEPLSRQQGEDFERRYLESHPDVEKNSKDYFEIADLIGHGVDPEKAYKVVCHDKIIEKTLAEKIRVRDEETKRKLKQSKTTSTSGKTTAPKSFGDAFERAFAAHGEA